MKYLTLQQIRKHKPCADTYKLAVRFFRGRAKIAVTDKAVLSIAALFEWDWLVERLVPLSGWKAYDDAVAAVGKAYVYAMAPRKVSDNDIAAAKKAYSEGKALAFARAYRQVK